MQLNTVELSEVLQEGIQRFVAQFPEQGETLEARKRTMRAYITGFADALHRDIKVEFMDDTLVDTTVLAGLAAAAVHHTAPDPTETLRPPTIDDMTESYAAFGAALIEATEDAVRDAYDRLPEEAYRGDPRVVFGTAVTYASIQIARRLFGITIEAQRASFQGTEFRLALDPLAARFWVAPAR